MLEFLVPNLLESCEYCQLPCNILNRNKTSLLLIFTISLYNVARIWIDIGKHKYILLIEKENNLSR